jgi:DNA-binding NtrC family response regulator
MPRAEINADTEPEERPSQEPPQKRTVLLTSSLRARAVIPLPDAGALTIGRGQTASGAGECAPVEAAVLLQDRLLSRQHLRISVGPRGHEIEDLASRNGTHVDGRRLGQPTRLSEGAIVLFGNHVAVYRQVTEAELEALRHEQEAPFGPVPTFSPALALVHARLRKLAPTDAELLLVGETGVGKELCARAIHRLSGRTGPFLAINCASLPAAQVETDLFGSSKAGLLEAAEGGTLLLDEIGDIPPELQARLFRFLQDRTIHPHGGTRPRRADVRIIATTTHLAVGSGLDTLRPDLLARLAAEAIVIAPLRKRPEDVPFLVAHFGADSVQEVEPPALRALCLYGWPLNVRELERALASAGALNAEGPLRLEHLPSSVRAALQTGAPIESRRPRREAPDRADLELLLKQHEGNIAGVARALDRKWNVVQRWLRRYQLKAARFRKG